MGPFLFNALGLSRTQTHALSALIIVFFFFSSRRRHTRSLCDWSSDVCSSDLRRRRRRSHFCPASQPSISRRNIGVAVGSVKPKLDGGDAHRVRAGDPFAHWLGWYPMALGTSISCGRVVANSRAPSAVQPRRRSRPYFTSDPDL